MSRKPSQNPPPYRHHKPSDQAVVTLNGKDHYLGPFDSEASHTEYDRLVAEWLAQGRRLPAQGEEGQELSVGKVMLAFIRHADQYYVKPDGKPSSEANAMRCALRFARKLYTHLPVRKFGPKALKACREAMIQAGLSRNCINGYVARIRMMFKWAAAEELVSPEVFHGLQAVSGLRRGRSAARETEPVTPVSDSQVEAIRPFVLPTVWAMVRVQNLTGMRSGELTIMRGCDIDRSSQVWVYTPATHKTAHHGLSRTVYLGPRAQEIIAPYVRKNPFGYLFRPEDAMETFNMNRRKNRRSPMTPSQAKRKQKSNPQNPPGDRYTTASYRRAITRACDRAGIPSWHPHQLRHTAATRIRKEFGIEAARVVLGHTSAEMTEVYAEIDKMKASDIMARVG